MEKNVSELPPADEVVFDDAPLEEVVCQLQFNEILIINEAPPAHFQERIRTDFPVYTTTRGLQISVSGKEPIFADTPTWRFNSKDQKWTVNLTSKFLALKTTAYKDYPSFWSRLKPVLRSFQEQYKPPFYTRVGLRYVNRIILERENEKPIDWSQYLHERIAGEYGDQTLQALIAESNHHMVLKLKHGSIGCRYSREVGKSGGKEAERFTLDFDHFIGEELYPNDVPKLLRKFNQNVYRLFVWCLTKKGYKLLKPRPKMQKGGQK